MKKIATILVVVLIVIQFFKPERNLSNDQTYHISTKYDFPQEVADISKAACDDCHSNSTKYPWYANVQPVAWWLNHHVTDGKKHLNFSEFTKKRIAVQNHKFEEIVEMMEEGEMPLSSYTWMGLHPEAKLTADQKSRFIHWAKSQMDTLKSRYPADSLVLKRN